VETSSKERKANDEDWAPHRYLLADDGMLELALGGFLMRGGPLADRVVAGRHGVGDLAGRAVSTAGGCWPAGRGRGAAGDVTDSSLTHLPLRPRRLDDAPRRSGCSPTPAYRGDQRDWDHFVGPDPVTTKKLTPIADRLEPVGGRRTAAARVDTMSAPGHTPGSTVMSCPTTPIGPYWSATPVHLPGRVARRRVVRDRRRRPRARHPYPGGTCPRIEAATSRWQRPTFPACSSAGCSAPKASAAGSSTDPSPRCPSVPAPATVPLATTPRTFTMIRDALPVDHAWSAEARTGWCRCGSHATEAAHEIPGRTP